MIIRRTALTVAAALVLTAAASAQSISTAQLKGIVKDPTGAAIPGATVTISDSSKGFSRTVTTDAAGSYTLVELPPGDYTLTASYTGFTRLQQRNVVLTVGEQADLPLALTIGGSDTVVTVESSANVIETERSSQSSVVNQVQITNLPTNGRNYVNFTLTNSQIARDATPSVGAIPHLRAQLRRHQRPFQLHQRRRCRLLRLHLRRLPLHRFAGCRPGIPDRHQRLLRRVRPRLRRRRQHRHQVRLQLHPRLSFRLPPQPLHPGHKPLLHHLSARIYPRPGRLHPRRRHQERPHLLLLRHRAHPP